MLKYIAGLLICLATLPAFAASNPSTFATPPAYSISTPYPVLYNLPIQGCNGTTDTRGALNTANALAATNGAIYIGGGKCAVASNITLTKTVIVASGGMFKPANGVTVTISGPIEAGMYQICDTSAGGHCDLTQAKPSSGQSFVEWWGVVGGDAVYDNGHAISNAALMPEALSYSSPRLCFLTPKIYSIEYFTINGARGLTLCGLGRGYTNSIPNSIQGGGGAWSDATSMKTVVTPTGNTHTTTTIDNISDMTDVYPGDLVSCSGCQAGAYVVSIGATSVVLNAATSSSLSGTTITFTKNDPARYLKYIIQNGEYLNGPETVLEDLQVICTDMVNCAALGILQSTLINTTAWWSIKGGFYQGYIGIQISKNYKGVIYDSVIYGNGLSVNSNHFWLGSGGQALALTTPSITEPDGEVPAVVRMEFNHVVLGTTGNASGGLLFQDQAGTCGGVCINALHWTQLNVVGPAYDGMTLYAGSQVFAEAEIEQLTHSVLTGEAGSSLWLYPYISDPTDLQNFCANLNTISVVHYRDQIINGGAASCLPSVYLGTATATSSSFQTSLSITRSACAGKETLSAGTATVTSACFMPDSVVTCTDQSGANPVACAPSTGTMDITGTGSDVIAWAVN